MTKWYDVLEIFQETWKKFGIINAVISNAGVNAETLFDETFDDLGRLAEPDLTNVKVNLFGHLYVVRCALHYFAKWPESRSQIVLTGSLSSYLDSPPLYQYGAAKFGVLGLMRCLRTQIPSAAWNATINMVAPWMTCMLKWCLYMLLCVEDADYLVVSPLIEQRFLDMWGDLPTNQPEDVGYGLLLPVVQETLNGKAFFVADGKLVEVEDKIRETQPLWLGSEQLSAAVDEGQRRLIPKVAPPKTG